MRRQDRGSLCVGVVLDDIAHSKFPRDHYHLGICQCSHPIKQMLETTKDDHDMLDHHPARANDAV
jgi:hypothetical protein